MGFYLHKEWRGAGLNAPYPLKRADLANGLVGSGIWCVGRVRQSPDTTIFMQDENGTNQPFYVDKPRLLQFGGRFMIRHRSISAPGYGADYAIAAHGRVHIMGPFENDDAYHAVNNPGGTPDLNWNVTGTQIVMHGTNIRDPRDHYAAPVLAGQYWLPEAGYYRLQVYAAAQTDAYDVDYLAELGDYNQENIHQFWATVL